MKTRIICLILILTMTVLLCACNAPSPTSSTAESGNQQIDVTALPLKNIEEGYGFTAIPDRFQDDAYGFDTVSGCQPYSCLSFYHVLVPDGQTMDEAFENNLDSIIHAYPGMIVFNKNHSTLSNEDFEKIFEAYGAKEQERKEVALPDGGFIYVCNLVVPEDLTDTQKKSLEEDTEALMELAEHFVSFDYSYPVLKFTTQDLDGNTVTSEELFARADVTFLNYFTSTCYWCGQEMGELRKLDEKLKGENAQVVLCLCDSDVPNTEEAKAAIQMIKENDGEGLYVICVNDDFREELPEIIDSFPNYQLVDRSGKLLALHFTGDRTVDSFHEWVETGFAGLQK